MKIKRHPSALLQKLDVWLWGLDEFKVTRLRNGTDLVSQTNPY
ncbi:hypothetical protein [Phormidium sp. CCY1219]|nr:hypothetical protein [Phormidium sp. CCY1219]